MLNNIRKNINAATKWLKEGTTQMILIPIPDFDFDPSETSIPWCATNREW